MAPRSVPAQAQGNSFHIYFVVHRDKRLINTGFYSPYISAGSPPFLWKLFYSPCQDTERKGIGLFLKCGGPDITGNSSQNQLRIWSCAVGFRLRLLHPSKWASLNIDPIISTSGVLSDDTAIPATPRDHTTSHNHLFQHGENPPFGDTRWALHALLQPGLFCDENHNFVVICHFNVHDIPHVIEDVSNLDPVTKCTDLKNVLEERAAVVDKLLQYDEVLKGCKAAALVLTLENEIKSLQRTLDRMPSLDIFS